MKIAAVFCLMAGSAAAFAPQQQVTKTSALSDNKFAGELGAQKPLGFWDPLNFLLDEDQADFDKLRAAEIKHGRVAMLAVTGHLVTSAGYRLPGNIDTAGHSFASIKTGLAGLSQIPTAGLLQILAFCGFMELIFWKQKAGSFPGDFGGSVVPVGFLGNPSEDEKMRLRAVELNNGRAAQMGIFGLVTHEYINGDPYIINSLLGYPVDFNAGL